MYCIFTREYQSLVSPNFLMAYFVRCPLSLNPQGNGLLPGKVNNSHLSKSKYCTVSSAISSPLLYYYDLPIMYMKEVTRTFN